jgi:hypothetical protein
LAASSTAFPSVSQSLDTPFWSIASALSRPYIWRQQGSIGPSFCKNFSQVAGWLGAPVFDEGLADVRTGPFAYHRNKVL